MNLLVLPGEERYNNAAQARAVLRAWDQSVIPYDGVKVECHTQDEAEDIMREVLRLRPDFPISVSWRFGREDAFVYPSWAAAEAGFWHRYRREILKDARNHANAAMLRTVAEPTPKWR